MTSDRDFKRRVRQRAAKAGESYQTARSQLLGHNASTLDQVMEYWKRCWKAHDLYRRFGGRWLDYERAVPVPVAAMQAEALGNPRPRIRRNCLHVLDHHANDGSTEIFRRALSDPVPHVRLAALHGLSCDRCKSEPVCLDDVVPELWRVLEEDSSAKVRHAVALELAKLVEVDARARPALERAALADPDEMVRGLSAAALVGDSTGVASRKVLRRRRRSREGRTPESGAT